MVPQEKWMQALDSFVHARKRSPDYCETDYWVGLTYLNGNMGVPQALEALRKAVECKYTKAWTLILVLGRSARLS